MYLDTILKYTVYAVSKGDMKAYQVLDINATSWLGSFYATSSNHIEGEGAH